MRRLPSSYNEHKISDAEICEVFLGVLLPSAQIPLAPRNYGERILYVGFTTERVCLVEIGVEDQNGELLVFHAREASIASRQMYREET